MDPDVEVLIYTDNLDVSYAEKLQTLADNATADYTSHLANDDSVAPDFIPKVLEALEQNPDYVGFYVRYTEAGVPQQQVIHSLQVNGWLDTYQRLERDLMYYNPIRRELAEMVKFRGAFCDMEWADDLRTLGVVKTEVFIEEEMHFYQHHPADNFHTGRVPMPAEEIPPLPSTDDYPFVRHISGG